MMKAAQQVGGSGGMAPNSANTPQMSPSESEGGSPSPECGDIEGGGYLPIGNTGGLHPHHHQQQQQHQVRRNFLFKIKTTRLDPFFGLAQGMGHYGGHQQASTPVSDLSPPPPTLTGSPPLGGGGGWMDTKPNLIQMNSGMGDPTGQHGGLVHHQLPSNLQQQMSAAAAAANYMASSYPWQYPMNQGLLT